MFFVIVVVVVVAKRFYASENRARNFCISKTLNDENKVNNCSFPVNIYFIPQMIVYLDISMLQGLSILLI